MKRFSWFTDGVRDAENGRWVLYEEHLAIVEKLKAEIQEAYNKGYDEGRWVGYHELSKDFGVLPEPDIDYPE